MQLLCIFSFLCSVSYNIWHNFKIRNIENAELFLYFFLLANRAQQWFVGLCSNHQSNMCVFKKYWIENGSKTHFTGFDASGKKIRFMCSLFVLIVNYCQYHYFSHSLINQTRCGFNFWKLCAVYIFGNKYLKKGQIRFHYFTRHESLK